MALKEHFDNRSWTEWDEDIRFRRHEACEKYRQLLASEIDFGNSVSSNFLNSGRSLKSMLMKKAYILSETYRYMYRLTALTSGLMKDSLNLMKRNVLHVLRVFRLIVFQKKDSFGVIRYITGARWKLRIFTGGESV